LAIIAGEDPPAFPGLPVHQPDIEVDRRHARAIGKAMSELKSVAPGAGSYFAESDFFELQWQNSYWGPNYPRLLSIKRNTTPPASSSCITGSAAKNGAPTASPG
ncbi:MAG TPA: BBE domain-containing protein, partial [Stellaceae bacterium]|nr:BBE domain-containing protein [Stellaceae bacterium]